MRLSKKPANLLLLYGINVGEPLRLHDPGGRPRFPVFLPCTFLTTFPL